MKEGAAIYTTHYRKKIFEKTLSVDKCIFADFLLKY